ncbi:MAG: DUF1501 domain-containing protein, partial [Planctomycetota bacterium]|nr:DUF1501 domain-containing protein [Planctomycetota bacterium]
MNLRLANAQFASRRQFLSRCNVGLGGLALASLMHDGKPGRAAEPDVLGVADLPAPVIPAKAKNIIYLHMSGSPPQQDLFDYKPELIKHNLEPCPDSLLENQRFAFIKGHPKLLGTQQPFHRHGESGIWVSDNLPHFSQVIDEVTVIKSMITDQFNHAPAELFIYTGSPRFGAASMGSWITYGLGSENSDLPGFVVLVSGGTDPTGGKSLWGSGFLPSTYQGVQCRSSGEPILYVNNPAGMDRDVRRRSLDALKSLNEIELAEFGDPETITRIHQYELAYRMQMMVPDVMDINQEPAHIHELYGTAPGQTAFANNCLLARRMVERGVRYVQLYDWGWDMHGTTADTDIVTGMPAKCKTVDKAIAGLITDLKQRGMLEDTLVVWGGEFGRTSLNEERNGSKFLGRDHHPHCFSIWMAGGGIKRGTTFGETDDLGYFIAENP